MLKNIIEEKDIWDFFATEDPKLLRKKIQMLRTSTNEYSEGSIQYISDLYFSNKTFNGRAEHFKFFFYAESTIANNDYWLLVDTDRRRFCMDQSVKKHLVDLCHIEKNNPYGQYFLACLKNMEGDHSLSQILFYEFYTRYPWYCVGNACGAFSIPKSTFLIEDSCQQPIDTPTLIWLDTYHNTNPNTILLYAADTRYFRAFVRDVCDSIILSGLENIVVHFHIPNIDHAAADLYDAIKEEYALSFSLSTESTVVHDKAYYTIARFLILPEIINEFQCTVVVMDIDTLLVTAADDFQSFLEGGDVGFISGEKRMQFYPWRTITAGSTFFNTSHGARLFVDSLVDNIKRGWQWSHTNWFIDQNALYASFIESGSYSETIIVKNMSREDAVHSSGEKRKWHLLSEIDKADA